MSDFEEKGLIVATIECKPGKGQGIIDLYTDFIVTLKPREPDCTHFILYRQIDAPLGVERFYTVEKFRSQDVIPFHRANPALEVFNRKVAEMDLLAKPIEIAVCEPVVGHKWL